MQESAELHRKILECQSKLATAVLPQQHKIYSTIETFSHQKRERDMHRIQKKSLRKRYFGAIKHNESAEWLCLNHRSLWRQHGYQHLSPIHTSLHLANSILVDKYRTYLHLAAHIGQQQRMRHARNNSLGERIEIVGYEKIHMIHTVETHHIAVINTAGECQLESRNFYEIYVRTLK
jgi:hypothetical protein